MRDLAKKSGHRVGELVYILKRDTHLTPEGRRVLDKMSAMLHSMLRVSVTMSSSSRRSGRGSLRETEPPADPDAAHPGEDLFWTHSYKQFKRGVRGISMNRSRVYFWNDFRIWGYDLLRKPEGDRLKYMGPEVDRDNN